MKFRVLIKTLFGVCHKNLTRAGRANNSDGQCQIAQNKWARDAFVCFGHVSPVYYPQYVEVTTEPVAFREAIGKKKKVREA